MKITKKQPLRPRGRSEDKRQSTKNVIRDAYINGPQKEVQIIPAKRDMEAETEKKKLRVCAYCRVSTDEDTQASSYELQVQNYTRMIRENPEWEFAGIFADEGISGTSVLHREHFLEMIEKCKAGEIDLTGRHRGTEKCIPKAQEFCFCTWATIPAPLRTICAAR